MTALKVFNDTDNSAPILDSRDYNEIAEALNKVNIRFEQWKAEEDVKSGDSQEKVIAAYQKDIDRLATCLEEVWQDEEVRNGKSEQEDQNRATKLLPAGFRK